MNEDITVVASVANPCDSDVTFTTSSVCLVYLWQVKNVDVDVEGGAAECGPPATTWVVPPHASVEQEESLSLLMLGYVFPGRHEVTVYFDDPEATMVQRAFDVIE